MFASAMDVLASELGDLPDQEEVLRLVVRLVAAVLLGGWLGLQRERDGKPAGVRTHMLVTLAAAVVVLVSQRSGMSHSDLSRVIQGIVTGIGFIGGGAMGRLWTALLATATAWLILTAVGRCEAFFEKGEKPKGYL
jgi:putative Mg2+ transporter-C (MgtC) family protein